jgi:tRNA G18 (ribose-2'-O)-methylase SpoU
MSNSRNIYVIANDIRSLHNVGSIFRSCDAFGISKLFLTGITGIPPRKEISKVSLGSEHRLPWEKSESAAELIQKLKKEGVAVVALDNQSESVDISSYCWPNNIALLLGNEVDGIDKKLVELCDGVVEIPMQHSKKSLNVSVALGIALFALVSKNR